jgi:hypothetical protein
MILPAPWPQVLDFFGTPVVSERSPGLLSSDAGRCTPGLAPSNAACKTGAASRYTLSGRERDPGPSGIEPKHVHR